MIITSNTILIILAWANVAMAAFAVRCQKWAFATWAALSVIVICSSIH